MISLISSHNSQGVVDSGVSKASVNTETGAQSSVVDAPALRWLFATLLLQHLNRRQQVVSKSYTVSSTPCHGA